MSQRQFTHGKNLILTGWDRPLQYFFLVIEDMTDEDSDDYIFTNLNLPNPAMTLEQIKDVLSKENIAAPATLFTDLATDKENNVGSSFHNYDAP